MNVRHLAARTAIAGVTTALAAGALVGVSTVAATAATVTNTYTCTAPVMGDFNTDLTVTGTLPVPQYPAGAPVPAGIVGITASASIPANAASLLSGVGATSASSKDFALPLNTSAAPLPISGGFVTEGGATTWKASGKNTAFTTPAAGTATAILPSKFTLTVPTTTFGPVDIPCVLATGQTPASLASITLTKQDTATVVAKKASAKKGKLAKVSAKVKGAAQGIPAGNVVVKEGKKVVGKAKLSTKGAAVVKLGKKLKVGKHTLTVSYAGNDTFNASKAKVKLTVKK